MSRIEYACEYKDQHNGIIYGIVYNTYEEALNSVNYYRDLIQNNGEEDTHGCIEVVRYQVNDDDEIIDGTEKILKTYSI